MNIAVIFAGGVGSRLPNEKNLPKQFLKIDDKPIIIHTLSVFEKHPSIDKIVVVCVKEWIETLNAYITQFGITKVACVLEGASSALGSQYIGLKMARKIDENAIVLIHDGVRPIIEGEHINKCIDLVKRNGSAITVSPATETIVKMKKGTNQIGKSIKRTSCFYARAPQCFFVKDILEAHEKAIKKGKYDYVDSATLLLSQDQEVYTVLGSAENIKVTTLADYYVCEALLKNRKEIK